jgi:hypothetical protein
MATAPLVEVHIEEGRCPRMRGTQRVPATYLESGAAAEKEM